MNDISQEFEENFAQALETKCSDCGAILKFEPGTKHLKCIYCGAENEITTTNEPIEELDFLEHINSELDSDETTQLLTVKCSSCGASTTFKPNLSSDSCAFCGMPIVVSEQSTTTVIKPKSLLPFKITQKEAFEQFIKWVKKRWFAPSAFKKYVTQPDRLKGMYIPYWTYDSDTTTQYSGFRGIHYYRTETYVENGETKTRQVKETNWIPVSGTVFHFFDDVLVVATPSLPRTQVDKLEPWDLENLTNFDDRFLSGFQTETYQINLKTGFDIAKKMMEPTIRSLIRSDIGGDEQRISSFRTIYDNISFKHLLLPIWISSYRFRKKVYRFLVNGRTGEVQGERPYSFWKIFLFILACIGFIVLLVWIFGGLK